MDTSPELLKRVNSVELDNILGMPFKVLDDGFVRVVDYMGSDQSIVQAARVSYGVGTKKNSDDIALIKYLMRHNHTTPFEMCEIKLHIRVPMDCWRQWIRHRTANVNEYSTRYSIAIDSFQKTDSTSWRIQSNLNKQGSVGNLDSNVGNILSGEEAQLHESIKKVYENRIASGVAREQARKDLPLSTYTESYWKIDLHNLFHFLKLRMDSHAQLEIRSYAKTIGEVIVQKWCPIAWEAFKEYRLDAESFSKREIKMLNFLQKERDADKILVKLLELSFFIKSDKNKPSRELLEFEEKLRRNGFDVIW